MATACTPALAPPEIAKPRPSYLLADEPLDASAPLFSLAVASTSTDEPTVAAVSSGAADSGSCSADGWCWESPGPIGEDLNAVWGARADHMFAVGDHGTIARYDGHHWQRESSPSNDELVGIAATASGLVALGRSGELLARGDRGWRVEAQLALRASALWGNDGKVFAVGDGGRAFGHDGRSWRKLATPTKKHLRHVAGFSPRRVFAVGDEGVVLRYSAGSWRLWSSPTREALERVWVGGKLLIVSTADRSFLHDGERWHDAPQAGMLGCWRHTRVVYCASPGNTWVLVRDRWLPYPAPGLGAELHALHSPDGTRAFAVGAGGAIHQFDGAHWREHSGGHGGKLRAIWGSGPHDVWAVGDSGAVLHSNGNGWSFATDLPTAYALRGVWGSSPTDVYAVGDRGLMAHFDGSGWRQMPRMTRRNLNAVWGRSDSDIYAAADHGSYLHFDGERWSMVDVSTHSQPMTAAGGVRDGVWLFALAGGGWHSRGEPLGPRGALVRDAWMGPSGRGLTAGVPVLGFDGEHWAREAVPAGDTEGVWGFADGSAFLVGREGTIIAREGRTGWRRHDSGSGRQLHDVWGSSARDVYVVGDGGAILRRRLKANSPARIAARAPEPATTLGALKP